MLYAAGNAANNNAQNTGDNIYATNVTLTPGASGVKPVISQGGVANGAGFQANIAPTTWISVFGSNLSTSTRTLIASEVVGGKLPTTLDGRQPYGERETHIPVLHQPGSHDCGSQVGRCHYPVGHRLRTFSVRMSQPASSCSLTGPTTSRIR
ncbi:MAG: hypothetical protein HYR60_18465 [Acidobacteria bacterium]|nr:hypothetical protein [Acidobacteriota bacterium]